MTWKKPDTFIIESHPFDSFIKHDTKFLIVGTFPTHKENYAQTFEYFYAGQKNNFWKIVEQVFSHTFKFDSGIAAIKERQNLLSEKKIGLTDMLVKCYRKNNQSSDEYLYPIILKDIFSLLDEYPLIERIILTSRTEVIGALGLFKTYFLQHNLELNGFNKREDKILESSFNYNGKTIDVLVPYSPSPRVLEGGRTSFDDLIKMYVTCLK